MLEMNYSRSGTRPFYLFQLVIPGVAGGRRGAALLRAAGVTDPPAANGDLIASPGDTSFTRGDLKRKASAPENNNTVPKDPLEKQCLPAKLSALEEIFMAVTTVYEMLRRRGKRTTFSNMKAAVEEASGRRFMVRCAIFSVH